MNEKIISALVGLAGACNNNEKTDRTDSLVIDALRSCYLPVDEVAIADAIRKEKYTISPNCETCLNPCGNTSDYDMNHFHQNEALKGIKEELLREVVALATELYKSQSTKLPEEVYKAISYFGYELSEDSYRQLIDTLKRIER